MNIPNFRIVVGYTDDQQGKQIHDRDVVRALHGVLYTQDEIDDFSTKSTVRCPTYGTCTGCGSAGPVGSLCPFCHEGDFMVTFVRHNRRILDAETFAIRLGQSILPAMADREVHWLMTPTWHMEEWKCNSLATKASGGTPTDEERNKLHARVSLGIYRDN